MNIGGGAKSSNKVIISFSAVERFKIRPNELFSRETAPTNIDHSLTGIYPGITVYGHLARQRTACTAYFQRLLAPAVGCAVPQHRAVRAV